MNKGIWPLSPHIYTPVKQKVMDYCLKVPKHYDQLEKVKYKWKKGFSYNLLIYRGANNCGTCGFVN